MSTTDELNNLRQQEYAQRQLVQKLQRELYQQPDPSAGEALLQDLVAAERYLAELEEQRAAAQTADEESGLILKAGERAGGGLVLGAETTGLTAAVYLRMAQVPTAYSHFLDSSGNPLLSGRVENLSQETRRLRVISYVEGYSAQAVDSFEIEPAAVCEFSQLPHFFRERVAELNELTRAMLNVLIEDLDTQKVETHRSYPIWLLARTTAPLYVQDPMTGAWQDITPYLGAFVTPNAPAIMRFLRQAVEHHPDSRFVGYQIDPSAVEPQVEALFNALKKIPDIRYVNSVISFTPEQGGFSQRVRLPQESLEHKEANCIDGTVLFSSLMEAISLNPAIILVPGHAFVAWETWSGSNEWRYLETTMIGSHSFQEARQSGEMQATMRQNEPTSAHGIPPYRRWSLRHLRAERGILPMA